MTKKAVSEKQRELFTKLCATHPEIEPKGKNMLYTSVNGHMFTVFSSNAEFGIRLNKEDREAFIKKHKTDILTSHGATMKEYVRIPDTLLAKTKTLAPYLAKSYDYITSLPPKATKKKKKK